jgi:cell division transport system permease protein
MSLHVMDSIATELRIGVRVFQETLGGIRRSSWMNAVIIITMASILSIFGTMLAFVMETQLFVDNIGSGLQISVYAKDKADSAKILHEIQALSHVKKVEVVSKDKAWAEMKQNYEVPEIDNPLPDTFHVQLDDQRFIEPTVLQLKNLEGVEKVNYAQSVLRKIQEVARITSAVGLAISIFLGTLTLFIISNTIHLLIEARGREIEIMRMMGVGNWYIRLPFLLQGAFYGLLGSLIAYLPLSVVEFWINKLFEYFQFSTSGYSHTVVMVIMVAMGIIVGAGGAGMSTHKYLRV